MKLSTAVQRGYWAIGVAAMMLCLCDSASAAEVGAAKHEYRISGIVVSSRDGAPVPRCHVEVLADVQETPGQRGFARREGLFTDQRAPSGDAAQDTTTDVHGRFSLSVARAGLWRLRASGRGFRQQGYDQHGNLVSMIALSDAVPEVSVTFRIVPEAVISGRVFDEAGEAVRLAQVRVEMLRPKQPGESFRGGQTVGSTQTDDRGRYEISGLGPGEYRVTVQVSPWYSTLSHPQSNEGTVSNLDPSLDVVYPETWYPGVTDPAAAGVVRLHGGEEQQADFNLLPVPSIHLKVPQETGVPANIGRRAAQARFPSITAALSAQGNPNQVVRLQDGNWEVGGLAPGTYQVRLPGSNGGAERVFDLNVSAGSPAVLGLDAAVEEVTVAVVVVGGGSRGTVNFVNPDTGQVYSAEGGRRTNGGPRSGAYAEASTGEADDDSRKTVHVPPHRYEVRLAVAQDAFITGLSATDAQINQRTVEVSGGAPVLTIQVETGRAEVSGVARFKDLPAAGALVLLVPAAYGVAGGDPVGQAETNTDGSFRLRNLVPGPYILLVIDHGWSVPWHDPATLAQYLTGGTPLELKPGAQVHQDVLAVAP